MIASHFDHQANWYKFCECEDCRLKHDEYVNVHGEWSDVPTNNNGGLEWDGHLSGFAGEPLIFFVRCYLCDKVYIAMEPFGETPTLYPLTTNETDVFVWNFYRGQP